MGQGLCVWSLHVLPVSVGVSPGSSHCPNDSNRRGNRKWMDGWMDGWNYCTSEYDVIRRHCVTILCWVTLFRFCDVNICSVFILILLFFHPSISYMPNTRLCGTSVSSPWNLVLVYTQALIMTGEILAHFQHILNSVILDFLELESFFLAYFFLWLNSFIGDTI